MPQSEMPIFTKTFDLLNWLLLVVVHFPRAHRHTFTQRLMDAAFNSVEIRQGRDGAVNNGSHRAAFSRAVSP